MAALIVPSVEIDVIILAAHLEQMRMVTDQLGDDPDLAQFIGNGVFPDLHRTPGSPEKIQRPAQDVVPGRHAGHGPSVMIVKPHGGLGKSVEVGGLEFRAPIGAQHMAIEAIEQNDNSVFGLRDHLWFRLDTR